LVQQVRSKRSAGDGSWRHSTGVTRLTRNSIRGGITCGGVARACDNERSGQRGVRGDATKDCQRRRCTRTSRECCRAALGIGGCVVNVPWDTGGRHACDTARNNERRGERGVRAACGGGSPALSPCVRLLGGLSSGVGAWCPRGGVRGVLAISLAWWKMMRRAAYCGALLTVGYAVESRGLCRAVCGFQLRRVGRVSIEL
jgi:hypothetical protein